jgi:preprotein translocase SecE subunit
MENNQQKWVNLSFVAASLLLAYVVYVLAMKFSVVFDFEGRTRHLDMILMFGSAAVGLAFFFGLNQSSISNTFMNETVAELGKVTWPTQDETMKATIFVLVSVTIAGFALWAVDWVWISLIGWILG